ncbi:MAG: PKD domain-containing protein, partial [Thermoplasmata archaeon]
HQYQDGPKQYTATLIVKDKFGVTDISSALITIKNRMPLADAGHDQSEFAMTAITFSGSNSDDHDGTIELYKWDFGDGTYGAGETTTHTYSDDGVYTVTLTVVDDDGTSGTGKCTITVLNNAPVAQFDVNTDTGDITTQFEFETSSYDVDGTVAIHYWDFGDGKTSTDADPIHQYTTDGTYTVTLQVKDDDGQMSTEYAMIITVINMAPIAHIAAEVTEAEIGDYINFDASGSYDMDSSDLSYFWDFGDGTSGTGLTVSHPYSEKGTYTVTLTVLDDHENSGQATLDIIIYDLPIVEEEEEEEEEEEVEEDEPEDDDEPDQDPDKQPEVETGKDTKERQQDWTMLTAIIAAILIVVVLLVLFTRKKPEAVEEEQSEEPEEKD